MKIIFASKFYYPRAGLESYLFRLKELLETKEHKIIPFSTNYPENIPTEDSKHFCKYYNLSEVSGLSEIRQRHFFRYIKAFKNMFFNQEAYAKVKRLCKEEQPQILQGFGVVRHLSASIFKAARDTSIKTVMRLSDYALLCSNSTALDGFHENCLDFNCTTKFNLRCLKRRCVKNSLLMSIIGLADIKVNHILDYYKKYVDHWIAPSHFIRDVFIRYYKIPEDKITHIPPFFDPGNITPSKENEGYILYAGRISREKGIGTLIRAIERNPGLKLIVAGTGHLEAYLRRTVKQKKLNAEILGFKKFNEVGELIRKSSILILPSEWYENSPNIVLEAYAYGKPVVATNIGGIPELVLDGKTGYLFEPGNEVDLLDKVNKALENSSELGMAGRGFLEERFNPGGHYQRQMKVYERLLGS
ncbi:MAG: glycosyltransferase family 4 protein [bacterium]